MLCRKIKQRRRQGKLRRKFSIWQWEKVSLIKRYEKRERGSLTDD